MLVVLSAVGGLMVYAAGEEDVTQARGNAGSEQTVESPCPEVEEPESSLQQYDEAPDLGLPEGIDYSAVIKTSCGDVRLDLLEDKAPKTVANFVWLAEEGFYDGLTWHRVERDFVIQSGDPDGVIGREPDGPGYTIPDELPEQDREYTFGVVAMANQGPSTGGSQFFVVVHDPVKKEEPAGLESLYSIFGRVSRSSYGVLEKIASTPVRGSGDVVTASQPLVPVYIESIGIRRRNSRS